MPNASQHFNAQRKSYKRPSLFSKGSICLPNEKRKVARLYIRRKGKEKATSRPLSQRTGCVLEWCMVSLRFRLQ